MYTLFIRLAIILFGVTAILLMNACGSAPMRETIKSSPQGIEEDAPKLLGEGQGKLIECIVELGTYVVEEEREPGIPASFVRGEQILSAQSSMVRFEEFVEALRAYQYEMQPRYYGTLTGYSERLKDRLEKMTGESSEESREELRLDYENAVRCVNEIIGQLEGEGKSEAIKASDILKEIGVLIN